MATKYKKTKLIAENNPKMFNKCWWIQSKIWEHEIIKKKSPKIFIKKKNNNNERSKQPEQIGDKRGIRKVIKEEF